MLNRSLLIGLTLSRSVQPSALFSCAKRTSGVSISMSNFRLSNFFGHAFHTESAPRLRIQGSHFTNFLKSAISYDSLCTTLDSQMQFGIHTGVTDNCLMVSNCTFLSCSNAGSEGGAIRFKADHSVFVTNSQFLACLATTDGGAIYIDTNEKDVLVSVTFCYFYLCYTRYKDDMWTREDPVSKGGAVYIATKKADLTSNNFLQNTVYDDGYGGSVYARVNQIDMSFCTIAQSHVDCNDTSYGGGVYIEYWKYGKTVPEVFADLRFINFTTCTAIYGSGVYIAKANNQVVEMNHTVFKECSDIDVEATLMITKDDGVSGDPILLLESVAFFDERLLDDYEQTKLIDGPAEMVYRPSNGVNFRVFTTKWDVALFVPSLPIGTGKALIETEDEYHWDVVYPTMEIPETPQSATETEIIYVTTPSASEIPDDTLEMAGLIAIIVASVIAVIALLVGAVILLKRMGICKCGVDSGQPEMGTKQVGYF